MSETASLSKLYHFFFCFYLFVLQDKGHRRGRRHGTHKYTKDRMQPQGGRAPFSYSPLWYPCVCLRVCVCCACVYMRRRLMDAGQSQEGFRLQPEPS